MKPKEINETGRRILIGSLIIAIIAILSLTSCGTRKVAKSETKEKLQIAISDTTATKIEEKKETSINVKEVTNITTDVNTNKVTETKTIKPIDATKKSSYKGVYFENAEINESKTVDLSNEKTGSLKEYEQIEKILEERLELISELNTQIATLEKENSEKKTERTASYLWLFWLLLIIPIWLGYRFIKNYYLNVKV